LIGGKWVPAASGKTFDVFNPAEGSVIARVPDSDKEDIDRAVGAARRAFESGPWRRLTSSERGRLIWQIGDLILEHADELAELESLDNGKPRAVARVADVPLSADLFHYMAGWTTKLEGNTIPISVPYAVGAKFHAFTLREPVGVVGQIIPWNFPAADGRLETRSGARLRELCSDKAGRADTIVGSATRRTNSSSRNSRRRSEHCHRLRRNRRRSTRGAPDVDKVAFTGSTEVGKIIVRAAAGNLKKVSLELGGKSPNIIFKDVGDLDAAGRRRGQRDLLQSWPMLLRRFSTHGRAVGF
jgi:phenylacetaldehyde dehydrogenase